MAAAARLKGTKRYRAYGNLDLDLAREAAPMIAYGSDNAVTFVSNRLDPRCRILRPQLDLAAVCLAADGGAAASTLAAGMLKPFETVLRQEPLSRFATR
jgi:hypothetical protein